MSLVLFIILFFWIQFLGAVKELEGVWFRDPTLLFADVFLASAGASVSTEAVECEAAGIIINTSRLKAMEMDDGLLSLGWWRTLSSHRRL